jgi:hypothetical protein
MQLIKSFKSKLSSLFRRKRNRDRVYVYDPDLEHYRTSWFLKFYSALGCIHLPRPEKYNPDEFTDIFGLDKPDVSKKDISTTDPSFQTVKPASETDLVDLNNADLEDDLDVISLEDDLPPVESEGDQEYPLAMLIAWEYPKEEMPKFFYLGYY